MGLYVLTYVCIAWFGLATGYLVYRHMTLPVHVRWEIYPVQHEPAAKAAYGGSYMEELNWWEKKPARSLCNELSYMTPEMLLLRGVWKENRRLWWVSFPFHFGMYLMIATFALLLLNAGLSLWDPSVVSPGAALGMVLNGLIFAVGWTGLVLGIIGGLGMLYRRLADPEMRAYASLADYFNIVFIVLFFLSAFISGLLGDPWLEGAKAYIVGLLTGGHAPDGYAPGVSGTVAIVSASLLIAYIPLTHMSHMFMKYFLYHRVKWDDAPNRRGGRIEAAIMRNMQLKPTWQAKHIAADGRKTWRDTATEAPTEIK